MTGRSPETASSRSSNTAVIVPAAGLDVEHTPVRKTFMIYHPSTFLISMSV
ncbi:hypothetical protein E6C60_3098 [Paenibacillus algicola]|uniref:Uncharacterized protein n=1 Tax=Paenibacillus algicola TaxID=2565926 RepID=A0A4P8XSY9_9BACL|nr:hypothetical protein E6C60_3098 [Paenibacillus algicola]